MKHRKGGALPGAWQFTDQKTAPHSEWDGVDHLEKDEEHACDILVRAIGFEVIRFSQPRETNQTRGIADRLYVHRGRGISLWWEVKRPKGGTWSADQQAFGSLVGAGGGRYGVGSRWDLIGRLAGLGFRFL